MLSIVSRCSIAAILAGTLALGGCATVDSVKHAQETADQAMSAAQAAGSAAQHAQSSADAAAQAAQQAQSTAEQANTTAQSAANAAQAANAKADEMSNTMQNMKATHRSRHGSSGKAKAGERG
jgi:methyl-accepting chemotaxis protein